MHSLTQSSSLLNKALACSSHHVFIKTLFLWLINPDVWKWKTLLWCAFGILFLFMGSLLHFDRCLTQRSCQYCDLTLVCHLQFQCLGLWNNRFDLNSLNFSKVTFSIFFAYWVGTFFPRIQDRGPVCSQLLDLWVIFHENYS